MDRDETFNQYRPLLFSIAYRMLGSVMEAEDIVQEAFLRWQRAAEIEVQSPKAYLSAVVTRLCIDALRSARVQREAYLGPWLPEPLATDAGSPGADTALAESLSMAFLVLLERLTPTERAVFLLREVFDYDYAEIATIVGKSEANCRQMVRRARQHLAANRPRFDASPEQRERLTEQFLHTCVTGDLPGLIQLLADDITLWSDGGGKAAAASKPIHGPASVARFLLGVLAKSPPTYTPRLAQVNGQPAIVGYVEGQPQGVLVLDLAAERIRAIYIVVNPDKLKGLTPAERDS
ncbi:MAG TPA: RNA polymerase sigma-70 factor [Ardenticatenaceae bacterium]|nr:RNA polymerase sigma-70 factor [Ardenticatenaceae bacterium]